MRFASLGGRNSYSFQDAAVVASGLAEKTLVCVTLYVSREIKQTVEGEEEGEKIFCGIIILLIYIVTSACYIIERILGF